MGKGNFSGMRRGFGVDEYGQLLVPTKIGNVRISRIQNARDRGGCTRCFPHGFESTNSTRGKNRRSWKHYRRTRYRVLHPAVPAAVLMELRRAPS